MSDRLQPDAWHDQPVDDTRAAKSLLAEATRRPDGEQLAELLRELDEIPEAVSEDRLLHMLHSVDGDDLLSGMYGGCRDRLLELDLRADGFDIEAELIVKAHARGLTCALVPIDYVERVGEKKLRAFRDGTKILYRILRLRLGARNGHRLEDAPSAETAQSTQILP